MKKLKKYLSLFFIFGVMYLALEVTFRAGKNLLVYQDFSFIGESSLWMLIVGGLAGVSIGLLNEIKFMKKLQMLFQVLIGALIIDILELSSGMLLNKYYDFNIWNYTNEWLNLFGQISVPHTMGWLVLVPVIIWMDDLLRSVMYDEVNVYGILDNYKAIVTDFKRK